MGLFKNMKDAMGQANQAMDLARQQGGMAGMNGAGMAGMGNAGTMMAARGEIEAQAAEHNRIRATGVPGNAVIRGHVDTGEQAAGNPVWMFEVEVTPHGGAPYTVQHREIVSAAALGGYADGTSCACHIDPADSNKIAFG
jgi:hypothetical protein